VSEAFMIKIKELAY